MNQDVNGGIPTLASEQTSGGTALRTYLYGPQGAISQTTSGTASYLYRDPIGSITDVTDSSGTAQWELSYGPYGNPIDQNQLTTPAPTVRLGYAGQYQDPESGQYDMRAREYDPNTMRFDGLDPLQPQIGDQVTGAYVYVEGNPLVYTDPSGQAEGKKRPPAGYGGTEAEPFELNLPNVDIPSAGDVAGDISGAASDATGDVAGWLGFDSPAASESSTADCSLAQTDGELTAQDFIDKTPEEIRKLVDELELEPFGEPDAEGKIRKWRDPVTKQERVRIDTGHTDKQTGKPYDKPTARVPHVHGYDANGQPIRHNGGDWHFPLRQP